VRDWPARPCSCRWLSTTSGRVRATARTRLFRTTRTPRSGQAGGGTWWEATSSSARSASLEPLPARRRFIVTTICRHHSAEGVWSLKDVVVGKARVAAGRRRCGRSRRSGCAERGRRWDRGDESGGMGVEDGVRDGRRRKWVQLPGVQASPDLRHGPDCPRADQATSSQRNESDRDA